jgi:hypothetical protein
VNDSESVSLRLPGKGENEVLELNRLDGNVLLSKTEELKGSEGLLFALDTVNLNAKVLTSALPVELAVNNVEKVLHGNLLAVWQANEDDTRRNVGSLGNPGSKNVISGGPLEICDRTMQLDGLAIEELHGGGLEDGDNALVKASKVLVIVRPTEGGPLLADSGESSESLARANIPEDDLLQTEKRKQASGFDDETGYFI